MEFTGIEEHIRDIIITYLACDLSSFAKETGTYLAPCSELAADVQTSAVTEYIELGDLVAVSIEYVLGPLADSGVRIDE